MSATQEFIWSVNVTYLVPRGARGLRRSHSRGYDVRKDVVGAGGPAPVEPGH